VTVRDTRGGRLNLDIESKAGEDVRAELARAVVESGWNLTELRAASLSLEDVFLELTASEKATKVDAAEGAKA
jgi:ABC-2 type transport system ATP-binding protein